MKIEIHGHRSLEVMLSTKPKEYDVLHYTNSDLGPLPCVQKNAKEWHHIAADDVDHYQYSHYKIVEAKDIETALEWSKDKEDLLVACHAGVSRSSATAYLIACREWGIEKALDILRPLHHQPNRLIVYIGSRLLDNQDVWDNYVKWMKSTNYTDPSQDGKWPNLSLRLRMGFKS